MQQAMSKAEPGSQKEPFKGIQAVARQLAAWAHASEPGVLETLRGDDNPERLRAVALALLDQAINFLDQVISGYGASAGRTPHRNQTFENAVQTAVRSGFDLGDLAQFVRAQLRRRRTMLGSAKISRAVLILESASAISDIRTALVAVARVAGRTPRRNA